MKTLLCGHIATMGNSAGKEQRPSPHSLRSTHNRSLSSPQLPESSSSRPVTAQTDNASHAVYSSRHGRGSRPDLATLLGIGSATSGDRSSDGPERSRESKQEREARRLEKERINRERERERSMREESVDGGYLVTQGVYIGIEDYSKTAVRQLMVCRPAGCRHNELNGGRLNEELLRSGAASMIIPVLGQRIS